MSLARYLPLERRRLQLLRRTPPGPLHDYLAHPFPDSRLDYRQITYLAVDLETTGLDPKQDHILSIGTVEIKGDVIDLSTAHHTIICSDQTLEEQSVVIHRLTHDQIAQGETITTALTGLLQRLTGKVLLAHYATVEIGFLRYACQRIFGGVLLTPVVDTLALAQRQSSRRHGIVDSATLRLAALRAHYHLPRYQAHNALSDAVAAAELFLAQATERCGRDAHLSLKSLLVRM